MPSENIDIDELETIRIVVNRGRGLGHQRAAITLMEKLRELGFRGIFNIQYDDLYYAKHIAESLKSSAGFVGRNLERLIPEFKATDIARENDPGQEIVSPALGRIRITRLHRHHGVPGVDIPPLSRVRLTMTAGDNSGLTLARVMCRNFNTEQYIGLQPTDWKNGQFYITKSMKNYILLSDNLRLSSKVAEQPRVITGIIQKGNEERVLNLLATKGLHSQMVYGLYYILGKN